MPDNARQSGTEPAEKRPLDITLTCGDDVKSLRDHLRSNIFDGDEEGKVTMRISPLLDEVIEVVQEWLKRPETDDDDFAAHPSDSDGAS
jgi:hypothetical protein